MLKIPLLAWRAALVSGNARESCGTPRGRSTLQTASTSLCATFSSTSRSDRALLRRKDYIESSRSVSNDTRDWIPRRWKLGVLGPFLISRSSEVLEGWTVCSGTAAPLRTPDDRVDQYRAGFFVERPEVAVKMVPPTVRYLLFNDTRALNL